MSNELEMLRAQPRRELAIVPKSTALVVWKPRPRA
jgi:MerR family transcriptional regulator/heat shock protein HspR